MFLRQIKPHIVAAGKKYRAIALIGPRQSGKTTLARDVFADFDYISLENPDYRLRASTDPRLFLKSCHNSTIIDEVQNVPELFSYLQEILDDKNDTRKFILTGSNSFLLSDKISQSLAGRVRIFSILPLTYNELPDENRPSDLDQLLFTGLYPRIYDQKLDARNWLIDYYATYLQKDINMIANVQDRQQFDKFVRLCAGRVGQLGQYSSIASEVGVSQPTITRWASILESSFIIFRLAPYFKNFSKKIVKSPKLYFYDTGLLCYLLGIRSAEDLEIHSLRGQIFENYIVSELAKLQYNQAEQPNLYFWRDQHGHEVDILVDNGTSLTTIEVKSGLTFQDKWLRNLDWFEKHTKQKDKKLVYGGDKNFEYNGASVVSWKELYLCL